ncbi:MAG: T9SS type A sorting domain-containing protein, partial [Flavobacteriales bacterium]|nr:T9SS type A sorting domain-containing protein [Flavobacteriales bacterium]
YEDSELQSQYCNETYDLSQSIYSERDDLGQLYSNPNVPVKGYRFRFEEQGGGLIVNYTNLGETPYITLASVPGLEYGTTYDVSVSHKVRMRANGSIFEFWSQYGTPCPITIQADVPTTQLQSQFCPSTTDLYLEDQIQAVPVPGADQYRFTFDGPGGPFVETSSNYAMFLYNVGPFGGPGLQYGSVGYNVTVEVQVNGAWSAPGASCLIAMASEPENTEVQGSYCGGSFDYPDPNFILAEYVYGATGYEWEWTPTSGQTGGIQTTTTNGISLAFHTTDLDLSGGGSWDVRVRALADGQNGSFSTVCVINITAAGPIAPPSEDGDVKLTSNEVSSISLYPNPNTGTEFILELDEQRDGTAPLQIAIYDITGSLVFTEQISVKGAANIMVRPDQKLKTGLYLVRVWDGDVETTLRMMVE